MGGWLSRLSEVVRVGTDTWMVIMFMVKGRTVIDL